MANQIMAVNILFHVLLPEDSPSTEEKELIGKYLNDLIDTRNPDLVLYHRSLERLRGTWTDEQILEAIEIPLSAAETSSASKARVVRGPKALREAQARTEAARSEAAEGLKAMRDEIQERLASSATVN